MSNDDTQALEEYQLQQHFERAIRQAFDHEDSVSIVADALVRALSGKILRHQINEAYDRNNL